MSLDVTSAPASPRPPSGRPGPAGAAPGQPKAFRPQGLLLPVVQGRQVPDGPPEQKVGERRVAGQDRAVQVGPEDPPGPHPVGARSVAVADPARTRPAGEAPGPTEVTPA